MSRIVAVFWILFGFFFPIGGMAYAAQIATGNGGFTLQVVTGGTVWAWGNNGSGQLGDGTFVNHAIAEPVSGITSVVAVAAGGFHSLARKTTGRCGRGEATRMGNWEMGRLISTPPRIKCQG